MSIKIRCQDEKGIQGISYKLIGQLKKRVSLACMCSALRPLKAEETAFSLNIFLNTDRPFRLLD